MPNVRVMLMVAIWLGNVLPAVDSTLLGTALPTIIGQLGGLNLYGSVVAINLLTNTTGVLIFGKLSDLYGRKPFFLLGVTLYLVGNVLCGLVQSIEQLILCRAIVGVGLGAVIPMGMTIMADAFAVSVRARVQWIFATTWLGSSIVCPALASFVIMNASWRMVFFLPVPLALGAFILLWREYHEHIERREHSIDFLGAGLMTAGVVSLLMALSPGGRGGISFGDPVLMMALAIVLLALFVWNELHVAEPLVPLKLVFSRVVGISVALAFVTGVIQFGANSYLPLFAQGAQGGTSANAAAALAPLTIGWPIAAGVGGFLLLRWGYRTSIRLGMTIVAIGISSLVFIDRHTPLPLEMAIMFFSGTGFGFTNVASMLVVQEMVEWHQRGVVTGSVQFARSIGGSIGVAVMGALLTWHMAPVIETQTGGQGGNVTSYLLDPTIRNSLAPDVLLTLQQELALALHNVFVLMAGAAVLGFIAAYAFPHIPLKRSEPEAVVEAEVAATEPV